MDNTGIMPVMPVGGSAGEGFGGSSGTWIFGLLVLLALLNGGFGGLGGNKAALGYENLATSAEVQRGFDAQNAQAQSRDILSAVTGGTASVVGANAASTASTIAAIKDGNALLVREIGGIGNTLTDMSGRMAECCCNTLRAIDGVNYNAAMSTAAINENVTAQTQKILDAITGNRIAEMQEKINQLQLAQSLCGIVRYPMQTVYSSGANPFCGCGCPTI